MAGHDEGGGALGGAYARVEQLIAAGRCAILDGAVGTELIEVRGTRPEVEEHLWGLTALLESPDDVRAVHRRYVEAGCDVITTDTWALPTAVHPGAEPVWHPSQPVHWMDVARTGVRVARAAAADAGRVDEVAVAFSLNGDVDTPAGLETIRLLARAFEDERPDLILVETLSLVREETYATIEALQETGLPLWLSFRRCRHGVCGVYGEHWGGPEGDAFGRAARRFEAMGVGALLVNCIPPDHVTGMLSWLRDFTDLPLGAYPNLGYLSAAGWRHAHEVDADAYGELALAWRAEGAQIVGGCCGVGPEQIRSAATALRGTRAGTERPGPREAPPRLDAAPAVAREPWTDRRGRPLVPLDLPALHVEPGVAAPTQASLMLWKHLDLEGIGAHQRCLDVGCGSGLLAIALARNGAAHVHAIDVEPAAVQCTRTNAFRNEVGERVSVAVADLYPWVPEERYDVIVANLTQMPADPFEQATSHRPVDFWGRNLLDHLLHLLPEALADDGVAYVVQQSIVGARCTVEQLARAGCRARVVDFGFEPSELLARRGDQVARVERQSDAYHLTLGGERLTVAYLLEISRARE